MRRLVLGGVLGVMWASSAWAQTPVINPSRVEFDSVDHAVACPGDNCITGYRVEVWLPTVDPATGSPVSQNVVANGMVGTTGATPAYKIDRAQWGVSFAPGVTYVVRLVAVGEGTVQSARSLPSGPFARTATAGAVPSSVRVVP